VAARVAIAIVPLLIVSYGALLRLDAFTDKYGLVEQPHWVRTVQQTLRRPVSALHPAAVAWSPIAPYPHRDGPPSLYRSDPYTYLQFAREMRAFSAAHYREPVFPFVTKIMLWLLANQDFAVSAASGLFSVLLIAATYWLGALAFSRWAGLAAALLLAVECDAIAWGVDGWRDEAFACAVVSCAWALLRYRRQPAAGRAAVVGVLSGLACLVRLTSLSFLAPAFVWIYVADRRPWRVRLRDLGLAALVAAALAGPYVINCWRVYGDPFYAINFHTRENFTDADATTGAPPSSVRAYLDEQLRSRVWRTADTVALGVTEYPFDNKWTGFGPWSPALERWLPVLALAGLALWCLSSTGRFLLLIFGTAILPFALTWKVAGDWRFTEFAYPFFLIAAASAVTQTAAWMSRARLRGWLGDRARLKRDLLIAMGSAAAIAAAYALIALALPMLTFQESLRSGDDVSIVAGDRDRAFFAGGWSAPLAGGNVVTRTAAHRDGDIRVPLPSGAEYTFTLRADPSPKPADGAATPAPSRLRVSFNGVYVADVDLQATPGRVGSYNLKLPPGAAHRGINRLTLALTPAASSAGDTFALWYVRFHPVAR
jgi:hypothetical protein